MYHVLTETQWESRNHSRFFKKGMRWMELEPIIQRSKSKRKTPIQYINAYIWNLEIGNNDTICETAKEAQM